MQNSPVRWLALAIADLHDIAGFLAETEDQVSLHLDKHLYLLPSNDLKSRAILEQMRIDELRHATKAKLAGGISLPYAITTLMRYTAKILTAIAGRV